MFSVFFDIKLWMHYVVFWWTTLDRSNGSPPMQQFRRFWKFDADKDMDNMIWKDWLGIVVIFRLREKLELEHSQLNTYDDKKTHLATKPNIYTSTYIPNLQLRNTKKKARKKRKKA